MSEGLRVLASGVDTLHASARGVVRPEVWDLLEEAKRRAQLEDDEVALVSLLPLALSCSDRTAGGATPTG